VLKEQVVIGFGDRGEIKRQSECFTSLPDLADSTVEKSAVTGWFDNLTIFPTIVLAARKPIACRSQSINIKHRCSMANRGYSGDEMEQIMGATPSGEGMAAWSREAPGFQVEKMSGEIPVRIVAAYPLDVLVE